MKYLTLVIIVLFCGCEYSNFYEIKPEHSVPIAVQQKAQDSTLACVHIIHGDEVDYLVQDGKITGKYDTTTDDTWAFLVLVLALWGGFTIGVLITRD